MPSPQTVTDPLTLEGDTKNPMDMAVEILNFYNKADEKPDMMTHSFLWLMKVGHI